MKRPRLTGIHGAAALTMLAAAHTPGRDRLS
ncbi:hypothetical protein QBC99_001066 [Beijerinckia sp. GAS462]|nr:hypothetical protein [Beijerinckia sp. GAS462]